METINKISATEVEITTPQVRRVNLDSLMREKEMLEEQRDFFTTRIAGIDKMITDIKALGVKTQAEIQTDIIKETIK